MIIVFTRDKIPKEIDILKIQITILEEEEKKRRPTERRGGSCHQPGGDYAANVMHSRDHVTSCIYVRYG